MFTDSEDDEFSTPTKSNLAVLFASKFAKGTDSSLTYSAPKQPQKTSEETSLFCAKIVNIIEGNLNQEAKTEKYGFAIIGSQKLETYELVLYKTKQNILTRTKISQSFNFSVQDFIYGSFNDRSNHWVVKFKDKNDATDFCNKLKSFGAGITKTNTEASKAMFINSKNDTAIDDIHLESNGTEKSSILSNETNEINSLKADNQNEKNKVNYDIRKIGVSVLPISPINDQEESHKRDNKEVENDNKKILPKKSLNLNLSVTESSQNQFVQNVHFSHSQVLSLQDPLSILATETRISSCETRFSLAQIQSKLDQLLNSVQNQDTSKSISDDIISKNKVLQLKLDNLEEEVRRMSLENQKLEQNQNKQDSNCIKLLENENKDLKNKVLNQEIELSDLKKEIEYLKSKENNLTKVFEENDKLKVDNEILTNKLICFEERLKEYDGMKEKVVELNEIINEKEKKIADCKKELECYQSGSGDQEDQTEKIKIVEKQVKDEMNLLYQTIVNSGVENDSPLREEFKPILIKYIKNCAFKIIGDIKDKLF